MATEKGAKHVFLGLLVLSIVLLALVALPLAKALFLAAVLAGAFQGLQDRLTRRLRGRATLSAGLLVFGIVVVLLAPLAGLGVFIVGQTIAGINFVTSTLHNEGMGGIVHRLPGLLQGPAARFLDRLQTEGQSLGTVLQEQVTSRGATAAEALGNVVSATGSMAFQLVMMLIALFFLLIDGRRLIGWLEGVSPLKHGQTREILYEFRSVSISVLLSTLGTAGVQTVAAGIGYFIARVPVPLFFCAVTFFMALIPAIGAASVCLVAALLLLATGHTGMAIFLAIWGLVVVGLSDNVVKPLLAKKGMNMHGAIVFFALIGGLAFFGTIGLILGPLVVAFFLTLVRIYQRDYGRPRPGAPPTPPSNQAVEVRGA